MFSINVPVVDVNRDNFGDFWPAIILAIKTSSFVGVDVELSGLGCRRKLMAKSIEDRYKSIADVARTRSILSLGLSCFKYQDQDLESGPNQETFQVQTFNITALCNEDYMVEPGALKFLVEHGFDFNKQYACGVPYYRGLDKKDDREWPSLRLLYSHLLAAKKPVALHNGLVDLVFLYQNLYCELPPTSAQFIADLSEIYGGGLLDSKYVAEYEARMQASYLEYVFRKSQRENAVRKMEGGKHIVIDFCQYPEQMSAVLYQTYSLPLDFARKSQQGVAGKKAVEICETFAAHGYCHLGIHCPKSHDLNAILTAEDDIKEKRRNRKRRKRNRRNRNKDSDMMEGEDDEKRLRVEDEEQGDSMEVSDGHANESNAYANEPDAYAEDTNQQLVEEERNGDGGVHGDIPSENVSGVCETKINAIMSQSQLQTLVSKKTGVHRAGFDAFMTGFAVATFIARFGTTPSTAVGDEKEQKRGSIVEQFNVSHLTNKLYLSGKEYPLSVTKSSFTKTSLHHREKMIVVEKLTR